jgi:hypothetical protein
MPDSVPQPLMGHCPERFLPMSPSTLPYSLPIVHFRTPVSFFFQTLPSYSHALPYLPPPGTSAALNKVPPSWPPTRLIVSSFAHLFPLSVAEPKAPSQARHPLPRLERIFTIYFLLFCSVRACIQTPSLLAPSAATRLSSSAEVPEPHPLAYSIQPVSLLSASASCSGPRTRTQGQKRSTLGIARPSDPPVHTALDGLHRSSIREPTRMIWA